MPQGQGNAMARKRRLTQGKNSSLLLCAELGIIFCPLLLENSSEIAYDKTGCLISSLHLRQKRLEIERRAGFCGRYPFHCKTQTCVIPPKREPKQSLESWKLLTSWWRTSGKGQITLSTDSPVEVACRIWNLQKSNLFYPPHIFPSHFLSIQTWWNSDHCRSLSVCLFHFRKRIQNPILRSNSPFRHLRSCAVTPLMDEKRWPQKRWFCLGGKGSCSSTASVLVITTVNDSCSTRKNICHQC